MLLLFRFLSGFFFYVQFACVLYASGALSAVKLPSTYPDPSLWPDRDYVILFPSLLLFIALSHITHKHSHAEYYVTNPLSSWFQYWNYPNAQLQRILYHCIAYLSANGCLIIDQNANIFVSIPHHLFVIVDLCLFAEPEWKNTKSITIYEMASTNSNASLNSNCHTQTDDDTKHWAQTNNIMLNVRFIDVSVQHNIL